MGEEPKWNPEGVYAKQPYLVWTDKGLTDAAKTVFACLSFHQRGGDPKVHVSHSRIAELSNLSRSSVSLALKALEERGHIQSSPGLMASNAKVYTLMYSVFGWEGSRNTEDGEINMERRERITYKCLTLYQPHATLVAIGAKKVETRPNRTSHRGILAIHAGLSEAWLSMADHDPFKSALRRAGYNNAGDLPKGRIVGLCEVVDCFQFGPSIKSKKHIVTPAGLDIMMTDEELAFGDYRAGRFGYVLDNANELDVPILAKGQQGMWDWEPPKDFKL